MKDSEVEASEELIIDLPGYDSSISSKDDELSKTSNDSGNLEDAFSSPEASSLSEPIEDEEISTSSLLRKRKKPSYFPDPPAKKSSSNKLKEKLLRQYTWLESTANGDIVSCKFCLSEMAFNTNTVGRHSKSVKHQNVTSRIRLATPVSHYFGGGDVKNNWCTILEASVASGIIPRTLNNFLTPDVIAAIKKLSVPLTPHYLEKYLEEVRDTYPEKMAVVLDKRLPFSVQIDDSSTKDAEGVTHVMISNMEGCWLFSSDLSDGKTADDGFQRAIRTIKDQKLMLSDCVSVCSDNANSAHKCARLITSNSHFGQPVRCAAHALNLVEQHFCESLSFGNDMIISVSNCLFGAGDLTSRRGKAKKNGIQLSRLHYVSTRWSSRVIVADNILLQWNALQSFFEEELEKEPENKRLQSLVTHFRSKVSKIEIAIVASLVNLVY